MTASKATTGATAVPLRGSLQWGVSLPETPLSEKRDFSDRSLDELDHGVDRLARRDDETAAPFDKGD